MKLNFFYLSSFLVLIILSASCVSTNFVAKKITVESGQVPSEMQTEDFILIGVLKERRSYDRYVKKEFAMYSGKYVLATEEEIEKKYSDTSKYRYVMDYEKETDFMSGRDSYGQAKKQQVIDTTYLTEKMIKNMLESLGQVLLPKK